MVIWCSRGGVKPRFHGNSELLKAGRIVGLTYVYPYPPLQILPSICGAKASFPFFQVGSGFVYATIKNFVHRYNQ